MRAETETPREAMFRGSPRRFSILAAVTLALPCLGCASSRPQVAANPILVRAQHTDGAWEAAVNVVHDYFEIDREHPFIGSQPGVIETKYKVGASLLEPWHIDTHGLESRVESTLQSIRRRAFINVAPTQGGLLVGVEVFKEIEDLPGVANNTAGGATFQQSNPLRRDLDLVVGQSAPPGWVLLGRDELLEQEMLRRLQAALSR